MCRSEQRNRIVILLFGCSFLTGCIQEMSDQPRYDPLEAHPAYVDQLELLSRTSVPGTVPRGQLQLDEPFFTGKANGEFVSDLPPRVLAQRNISEVLAAGRERYTVFCSHCHGQVGGGFGGDPAYESLVGIVVQRGYPTPPTYHQERLRRAAVGHFFDVITNGLGRMPPHDYLIPPEDRWAIAAYMRALQFSQFALPDILTADGLQQLGDRPRHL